LIFAFHFLVRVVEMPCAFDFLMIELSMRVGNREVCRAVEEITV